MYLCKINKFVYDSKVQTSEDIKDEGELAIFM